MFVRVVTKNGLFGPISDRNCEGPRGRDARRSLNGFVHFQYLNIIVVISGSKRKNIGFLHSISDDDRNAGLLL